MSLNEKKTKLIRLKEEMSTQDRHPHGPITEAVGAGLTKSSSRIQEQGRIAGL